MAKYRVYVQANVVLAVDIESASTRAAESACRRNQIQGAKLSVDRVISLGRISKSELIAAPTEEKKAPAIRSRKKVV